MALIELDDVRRSYDLGEVEVRALRSVTLNIEKGEYVALIIVLRDGEVVEDTQDIQAAMNALNQESLEE